jgi:hypothetical protein
MLIGQAAVHFPHRRQLSDSAVRWRDGRRSIDPTFFPMIMNGAIQQRA